MKLSATVIGLALAATGLASIPAMAGESPAFAEELAAIRHEFDVASFSGLGKSARKAAFESLVEHAADFSARYPDEVEAVAWNGIVLSTYAGEVSAMGAMKYAKAARIALHEAEAMLPTALDGGLYASLGALYSKVPGGIVGFGDDSKASEYFARAIEVDADNIDTNYFYGEFLVDQKQYEQAAAVLRHALEAPTVADRALFDSGRRAMVEDLLETAREHLNLTASQ
jgi:tetratricopeptide (TPR) repeat protein